MNDDATIRLLELLGTAPPTHTEAPKDLTPTELVSWEDGYRFAMRRVSEAIRP